MTVHSWMGEVLLHAGAADTLRGADVAPGEVVALCERVMFIMGAPGALRDLVWNLGPDLEEEVPEELVRYFRTTEAQQWLRSELDNVQTQGNG